MKDINLTYLRRRYGGHYVALWKGRVVAASRSNASLLKKILPMYRTRRVALMFVPPKGMACVYQLSS